MRFDKCGRTDRYTEANGR